MASNDRLERDTDEGFLHRWARRKSGLDEQAERAAPEEAPPREDAAAQGEAQGEAQGDKEADGQPDKTDADMPPLENIGPGSDVSEFFSPGVSEALRNQALRRLFQSPAYNVTDGLDDYAENYNHFEALGGIMTADRRHREEMEAARAAEAPPADEAPPGESAAQEPDEDSPDAEAADRDESASGGQDVAGRESNEDQDDRANPAGGRGAEA